MIILLLNIAQDEDTGDRGSALPANDSVVGSAIKVFVKALDYFSIPLDFGCVPGTKLHYFYSAQAARLKEKL